MLPWTVPLITTTPAWIAACTCAPSPTTRVSLVKISLSSFPSIRTVPSKVSVPLKLVPSPRKALRLLPPAVAGPRSFLIVRSSSPNNRAESVMATPLLPKVVDEPVELLDGEVMQLDHAALSMMADGNLGAERIADRALQLI